MKKIYEVLLIVFLCLALCLTMTSCFGEDDTTTAETPTTEAPTTEAPTTEKPSDTTTTTEEPSNTAPIEDDPYYTGDDLTTTEPNICEKHIETTLPAVEATCYLDGLTEGKICLICHTVTVKQEVIKAGHILKRELGLAATCTETGLTDGQSCTRCGYVSIQQEVTQALGHDFKNGEQCDRCKKTFSFSNGMVYELNADGTEYTLVSVGSCTDKNILIPEKYNGLPVEEANKAILADISESGALLAVQKIVHQYPHCWRCKSPIIYRATEQWFCSVDGFKEEALSAIKAVRWIPDWGEQRIENMVRDRADWCISRQRIWGVPIPIFYCADCHKPIISKETIKVVAELFRKEGSDAWYKYTAKEILGDLCACECGCHELEKETDIMDVWFDSGSSYASVLERENHQFPADLYIEGNDQYRGWFQSSLLTSVATRGTAPYKAVITHGMTVDGEGKKMSKSLGNGIDPLQVTKEYGADVLRLWVSSVDVTGDQRISKDILKQLSEIYRKIRNTIRILLANLGEGENAFNPDTDMVAYENLVEIDKWALSRLNGLIERVRAAYDNYTFHYIYHDIHNFCTIDMSKLYIDITKDRVYAEKQKSEQRRSAQTVMYIIANALTRLIAPILSFTAEETWTYMAHTASDDKESVFFNDMPSVNPAYNNPAVEEKYNHLFDFRDDVMKALEKARAEKVIGKSLEAKITIYGEKGSDVMAQFEKFADMLATVFIVSQVNLSYDAAPADAFNETDSNIAVKVEPADGEKCARCWMYVTDYEKDESGQALCRRCLENIKD